LSDNLPVSESAAPFAPVARRKVYELIADQLVEQIGSRRLRPGDVLPPERELTQLYRAGRSSVREALRMLESKGLIQSLGNGSFAVAEFRNPLNHSFELLLSLEQVDLHDLYELRRMLECEAAALAAERRGEQHLDEMDAAIREMDAGLSEPGGERYIEADLRFHLAVAEATGNRLVLHSMHAVREVIRRALMSIFRIPGSAVRSLEQHRAIRDAIAAGDPGRARVEMRAHLVRVENDVQKAGAHG
jgi:DNA-binding FadR family transcriptional regulator